MRISDWSSDVCSSDLDLMPENYWGGLLTGDLVTIGGWSDPCDCGRHGPYLEPDIRRISDLKGGEDKINCAGAPDAHDRAVEYLVAQSADRKSTRLNSSH